MTSKYFGARVKRLEDPALLTGRGRFTDDIHLPGVLHAAFVRSSHAHARILSVDTAAARSMPGVRAVYTAADLPENLRMKRIPLEVPSPSIRYPLTQRMLAVDEATFVGEQVAVVIADTPHQAEDAANAVVVDYDPLPAVNDCEAAFAAGSPTAHSETADNVMARFSVHYGDIDAAFSRADHVISETYRQHRGAAASMECRAVLATYDPIFSSLTVWSTTQGPHATKRAIVEMLEMPETRVRVIAGDVGGGFGPKVMVYPEEIVVPYCARLLGRPIKWAEDRRENFMATTQERDQIWTLQIAVDQQGKILGVRGQLLHEAGAYLPWGIIVPYISVTTFPGPYIIPAYQLDTSLMMTNKISTSPLRGAGRPQAVFAMERLLDTVARDLGLDRAEVRRRNLIPAEAMPYKVGLIFRDGKPVTYDSGDYPKCQALALAKADWDGFAERRRKAQAEGRLLGIGLANYVEGTGLGPFEGASVRILSSGRVLLKTGAAAQGQGHYTALAQICADELNVDISTIDVELGDTASLPMGVGAFASRTMVNAGSSVQLAASSVAKKLKRMAAFYFESTQQFAEVDEDSLTLADGSVRIAGAQNASVSFAEIARLTSGRPGFSLPESLEPGLEATCYFTPPQATYSNGTHVVEVEVDPETGNIRITRYIVVHDCGRAINPLMVEGQILGGLAHGIGNAFLEKLRYDSNATPLTTTLGDYLLPDAGTVPEVEIVHMESPSPLNPIGVKGAGEGGTIPPAPAIISAVEDALRQYGVHIREIPILPERLCGLVEEAAQA